MKNPAEVGPPTDGRFFIALRVITSGNRIPFTPLDDVSLDLVRSPDGQLDEEIAQHTHRWSNSRRQLVNRPEDGLAELICLSSVHPPTEGFADVSAG